MRKTLEVRDTVTLLSTDPAYTLRKSVFSNLSLLAVFFSLCTFISISKAQTQLTIAYGSDYKPFAWSENNQPVGVQKDFVEEILNNRLGMDVQHVTCPWKRCQEYVKKGISDGFFTVPTSERATYTIATSVPFYETHFVLHTGKKNPKLSRLKNISSLEELRLQKDLAHIHMLGSGWHENALKGLESVHQIVDAANIPIMLINLRADVYIEQKEMFQFQARELGLEDAVVTIDDNPMHKLGWHLFIAKKSKHLPVLEKVDALLKKLKETGELEQIKLSLFEKHGIQ